MESTKNLSGLIEIKEIKIEISGGDASLAQARFFVQGVEFPGSVHELTLHVPCQAHTVEQVIETAYSRLNLFLKEASLTLERQHQGFRQDVDGNPLEN